MPRFVRENIALHRNVIKLHNKIRTHYEAIDAERKSVCRTVITTSDCNHYTRKDAHCADFTQKSSNPPSAL
ncbi:hypothetical protein [Entomobacter blattae]|uniref:hypothetical protein n=1 Tax=Entomobacter blattae TaxID=2762277 RepID=UPI00193B813B|nr:hypothetical protein [Entomobacter blattae]